MRIRDWSSDVCSSDLCRHGRSLFERGLTFGSSGNISARLPNGGWLMTPTNVRLGELDPARLARLDDRGKWVDGDQPDRNSGVLGKRVSVRLALGGRRLMKTKKLAA